MLEFAQAARKLSTATNKYTFLLVGPDDRSSEDRLTQIEISELKSSLYWLGPRRDIPTLLAATDIFVMPTYYREGIPRALLEAASMGLPLIASDMPGCREVVKDGVNGFLIPPLDTEAMAAAILDLGNDPVKRQSFGTASRTFAVTRFDLGIIAEQTAQYYAGFLAQNV